MELGSSHAFIRAATGQMMGFQNLIQSDSEQYAAVRYIFYHTGQEVSPMTPNALTDLFNRNHTSAG